MHHVFVVLILEAVAATRVEQMVCNAVTGICM